MRKTIIFSVIVIILFLYQENTIADWVNVTHEINNLSVNAITATGGYIFAGNEQYVYRSSNNGDNWQQIYNLPALALASINNYVYHGYQNGVGLSTNYGTNWSPAGLNQWTLSLLANESNVYAGCFWPVPGPSTNRGVWISTNYGSNWTQTALNYINVYSLTVTGNYLFAGGGSATMGVYSSSDNGINWQLSLPVNSTVYALASNGNRIYAGVDGTPYGVYKSTNYGANWIQTSLNYAGVYALAVYGNYVFAGGQGGFYVSSDSGTTWIPRNEGMGTAFIRTLCIYNNYIFSGTPGVWRRPLSDVVGVRPVSNETPEEFKIYQNYPNPFNPVTNIRYQISRNSSNVLIAVSDITGRMVTELVNQKQNAGIYETSWDASGFSSGVYFYTLTVEKKRIGSHKMILSK